MSWEAQLLHITKFLVSNTFPDSVAQCKITRKYPYSPHRRDWNFLRGGRFSLRKSTQMLNYLSSPRHPTTTLGKLTLPSSTIPSRPVKLNATQHHYSFFGLLSPTLNFSVLYYNSSTHLQSTNITILNGPTKHWKNLLVSFFFIYTFSCSVFALLVFRVVQYSCDIFNLTAKVPTRVLVE